MTDHEALLRAVCARPDDDLPRLVLADWLDEQGDAGQAEFIRTQVQLATTPPWEPFAVKVKHRRPELLTGEPWRATLPQFGNGAIADWNPAGPFRRGFGYSLHVKQLTTFLEMAPQLLEVCPVGELLLPSGTREDWHALMNAPWLANIRSVRFTFASNLIEPVRALAASDYATNLESVAFDVCTSPAMGVIVEALVQSQLARNLKRLSFSVGNDTEGEIAEQLASMELPKLEALAFKTMSLDVATWSQLATLKYTSQLRNIIIMNQQFNTQSADEMMQCLWAFDLDQFKMSDCPLINTYDDDMGSYYSRNGAFASVLVENTRSCQIENCSVALEQIFSMERWKRLRQLRLHSCGLESRQLMNVFSVINWIDLVEIDISDNPIPDFVIESLLDMPIQLDLVALVLDGETLSSYHCNDLMDHFGEVLVLK